MQILAQLLTEITGKPREKVEIKWDSYYYVSAIFRLWELIFWRRQGIRVETTGYHENGKEILFVHTWEAAFCVAELRLRQLFEFKPFRIYIPMLATPQGLRIPASPYLFAIALNDVLAADGGVSGPVTITAGTNICVFWLIQFFSSGPITSCTAGGAAMTQSGSGQNNGFGGQIFYKAGPSTGSVTLTATGGNFYQGFYLTLSGVDQTNPIDNAGASHAGANASSVSVTVSASNCWMIGIAGFSGGNLAGVGNDFVTRFPTSTTEPMAAHSNGTIGTGSQTGSFTSSGSSSTPYIYIAVAQPSAGAGGTTTPHRLMMMGVGK